MPKFGPANVFDKIAQLFAQSCEHLILIFDTIYSRPSVLCAWSRDYVGILLPSRKGISSSLVLSGPRARAMVERRCIAFSLRITSSCWSNVSYVDLEQSGQADHPQSQS